MSDLSLALTIKVVDEATSQLKAMSAEFAKIGSNWEKLGFVIGASLKVGVTAAAGALATMTKNAIDSADEMNKASQKIGVSTESLSGLAYAAKLSDVSLEGLQGGLKKLSVAITEAQNPASEMANAFKTLGIQTKNADGSLRKADDVFKDVAASFAKAPDDVSKTAIAVQLFGKAGADLIPLLNSGKDGLEAMRLEAEKLGLIIDKDTAQAAENFNDSLTRLGTGAASMGLAIAKQVLPTLNLLAEEFVNAKKNGGGFQSFAEGLATVFRFVVKVIATAVTTISAFGKGIGAIAAAIVAISSGDFKGAKAIFTAYVDDVNGMDKANQEFIARIDATAGALNKEKTATADNNEEKKKSINYRKLNESAMKAEEKAFESAKKSLLKEADGFKDLTAVQKVEQQIAEKVSGFKTAAHQKELLEIAARVDARRQEMAMLNAFIAVVTGIDTAVRDSAKAAQTANQVRDDTISKGSEEAQMLATVAAAYDTLKQPLEDAKLKLQELQNQEAKNPGRFTKEIQDTTAAIQGMQKALDGRPTARESLDAAARATADATKETAAWQSAVGTTRDKFAELNLQEELLFKWLGQNKISATEFQTAMNQVNADKVELAKKSLTDLDKKLTATATEIQSTFSTIFEDAMNGQFDNIGQMFKKLLDKMVADALAAQLAKALFGDFGTTGSTAGSSGGSALASLFAAFGFRADGGEVTAGKPYIVGERGPEPFIPKTSGTIVSNQDMMAAMSGGNNGGTVNLTVHAIDSTGMLAAVDKNKRNIAMMLSDTRRTYNMR